MKRYAFASILLALSTIAHANGLPVTENAVFTYNGQEITISRVSTLDQSTISALTQTTATCSDPCLSPMSVAPSIRTIGEMDVIDFLSTTVASGGGYLVDARSPQHHAQGYIPASANIPTATLAISNPYRDEILVALGAEQFQGVFNFADAVSLVIFDAGPATQDASALILELLSAGYPPEKIAYYRGGMQVWTTLGLTTVTAAQ
ncbi:MAG: rhodanese-like domain-containing protein [Octadecabacter sp.]